MSENIKTFHEIVREYGSTLDLYTTAITRAHGKNHPEAFDVREVYVTMDAKVKEAGEHMPDLDEEFSQLRKITDNYTIPGDVCETYAGVYNMLSEVDKAYQS